MKKTLLLIVFIITSISFAQIDTDWKFSGNLQLRAELDSRDFNKYTAPFYYANSRIRLGVGKKLSQSFSFFAQMQDSRIWGQEASTLSNEQNLDLHQGYVMVENLFEVPLTLQAGRFEVSYGTERFIGPVGWHYVGRSFDGVRVGLQAPIKVDLFALHLRQFAPIYVANAEPGLYDEARDKNHYILGFWNTNQLNEKNKLDFFTYVERDNRLFYRDLENGTTEYGYNIERGTTGLTFTGAFGPFSTIAEGAVHYGYMRTGDDFSDILAYLASVQFLYNFGTYTTNWQIGAGADIVSGNDPESDKVNAFFQGFGTNHKFYGYMDYFINIPANTAGAGLNDYYLMLNYLPKESKFNASLNIHQFTANQPTITGNMVFGQEFDLTLRYNILNNLGLSYGLSAFIPGNYMKDLWDRDERREDVSFWSYLMLSATF